MTIEGRKDQLVSQMESQGNSSGVDIIEGRHLVSIAYCKSKGWDINSLSFPQIIEIREKQAWISGDVTKLS